MNSAARRRPVPRLSQHWRTIEGQLKRSSQLALFFDFDGTLVPFARRPEDVRVPARIRRALSRLARTRHVRVFVISGRRRANLQRHLAVRGVTCLGLYGWEADSTAPSLPSEARAALGEARGWLAERRARYPGLWIEDKRLSVSVHFREIPVRVRPQVRSDLARFSRRLRPAVRLFHNRLDAEFVPSVVGGKGAAVAQLLAQPELNGAFPVYFGNDLSDEPAFCAIPGGLPVIVGSTGPTCAHYAIPQQDKLADALVQLEELIA